MKKAVQNFARSFKNLLFPPRCVGCGKLYQTDIWSSCQYPFCPSCRLKWENEKLGTCPDCGLEMTLCNCGSKLLDNLDVENYVKLVNYSVRRMSVGRATVLYLKKHKSTRALNYFAQQLLYPVSGRLKSLECENFVVAYVPRQPKNIVKYGFDQSHELAKRLAKSYGVKCVKLFKRTVKFAGEQKNLRLDERLKNAKSHYKLTYNTVKYLKNAYCVLLVDDVITSGASLAGCVTELRKVYDNKIICVTLARTGKKRKK